MWEQHIKQEKEIQYQKDISLQNIKTQEEERKRIALLIHDDIGNRLNILSVWLSHPNGWNSERSKEIVMGQLPELITATRNISHALYPVNLAYFGIVLTLEELIANIESSLKVELIIKHSYTPRDISFEVQLYRIIQEFLSNVLKHAKASKMLIHLRDSFHLFSIILSDNGIGFDLNALSMGMGLRNIGSRIKSINAIHKWKTIKNKGSQLILIIRKP